MKCYVHQNTDAVGVCTSCGRGVCKACAIKLRGKIYCKEDAARLFDVRSNGKDPKKGPTRGPAIIIGSVFACVLGGVAALFSFILIYAGIIGGSSVSGPFNSLLMPPLQDFGSFQGYSGGGLLDLGFGLLAFGSFGVAAGYYFWRPSRGGGIGTLIFGLGGLAAAFELSTIPITYIILDPWFAISGVVIVLSLLGLSQMIRSKK